jgi:hypothetical protein
MGSDNNVRGYGSDGSSFVAVDNTGRGGGGNGGPVVSSTSGGGGAVNQRADAPAQMGLTNAASSKPGERAPTGSQNEENTATLDTIKVSATAVAATAPSNDLGFYLSQKYSFDRPYYHKYGGAGPGDWAVCKTNKAWCTQERGYDALTRFVYPGQDPSKPVQDRDVNMIYWPDGEQVGEIRTFLEPSTFSVYNITLPNHAFYDGFVRRQMVTQGDTLYLRTSGEGNNANEYRRLENMATWRPGFNQSNENFRTYMIQSWLKEQP